MNLLQYKSEEMVSSTELIRKSKNIFNKLQKKANRKSSYSKRWKTSIYVIGF